MRELEKILEEIKASSSYAEVADGYGAMCVPVGTIERIIRKYMNDGWISVEERFPTKEECEKNDGAFLVQLCSGEMFVGKIFNEYVSVANDYENHLKCFNTYIVAWRSLPEPYCLERSNGGLTKNE